MYETRVVIIDPDKSRRQRLKEQLNTAGHIVVAIVEDVKKGLRTIMQINPDVIMLSTDLGFEDIKVIEEHRISPVVLVSESDIQLLPESENMWIFGQVYPGMPSVILDGTIHRSVINFKKLLQLEREISRLNKTLEDRKIIERAKGLLISEKGYSEEQAFKFMRKLSMDRCQPMAEVASKLIHVLKS
ncbi:MAG: ANTAR domain-containing protein [Firmicutes bacterium]|nr:ANTAR domain-containing protein [Bacillota bacterium]